MLPYELGTDALWSPSRDGQVYLPSFTTFAESALTLFRAMFGNFDFDEFSDVRCDRYPARLGLCAPRLIHHGFSIVSDAWGPGVEERGGSGGEGVGCEENEMRGEKQGPGESLRIGS